MGGSIRHKIYITILISLVISIFLALYFYGHSYYSLRLEERTFHPNHQLLKPSGFVGHGLGVIGSLMIIIGVLIYMIRKRIRRFSRLGLLRNWLEFHIFLCILGPLMILYHTAFKFGGIVAVSFWSMTAVVISGIIGRYIYVLIPRTIEGRELTVNEIGAMRNELSTSLRERYHVDESIIGMMEESFVLKPEVENKALIFRLIAHERLDSSVLKRIKQELRKHNFSRTHYTQVIDLCKREIDLNTRIEMLSTVQNLFKNWHVVHLPFALIMLAIMIVHVVVAVLFGYKWIF
jgi:hypothetical protein